jgi:transcriptional regulator with XRE-family HTH domain
MLTTGNQLKAARSLAGLNQTELAKMAGVNTSTISAMESKGAKVLGSGIDTIKTVMNALDAAGVEVFDDYGLPGCRLKATQ